MYFYFKATTVRRDASDYTRNLVVSNSWDEIKNNNLADNDGFTKIEFSQKM